MSNKVALITGASKRIGATTTTALHQKGYRVAIHYNTSQTDACELAQKLNNIRANSATTVAGDLTNSANIPTIVDSVLSHFGRLDVLINNASSFYPTPIETLNQSQFNDLITTNMTAPLFLAQACLPALKESQGVIINMCDIHGKKPLMGHTIYCMAKAGLAMMTLSLANELAPDVRVNGIAPGAIVWPNAGISNHDINHVIDEIPLKRKGEAADIADAICYLVSAPYVNGQILSVDGGRSISASIGA
jgi:pteridine reductase